MTFEPGYMPTDQTRRKLSKAARGNKHSTGRIWSAESRAKLSAAMKGNKNSAGYCPTEEHRRKVSEAHKGKVLRPPGWQHAPETRQKISASLKGSFADPDKRMNLRIAQEVIRLFRPDVHAKKAALSSERMKAQNADPAFRAKVTAGQKAAKDRKRAEKPWKAAIDARWEKIASMRSAGMSKAAIARVIDVSNQRVCQILKKIEGRTT